MGPSLSLEPKTNLDAMTLNLHWPAMNFILTCAARLFFTHMPNTMFYVAVFLGGEWGVVDFTWQGKFVCMFLCIAGIALYSIPVGTLFDAFGAIVGLCEEEEEDEGEEVEESPLVEYN
mmetsp:Transcript_27634/g.57705  ORF Transcript_27634/g.57705 Transcript_27634/m.57705 type:complete len:118 (-) Transcript_27634:321-674(-)